MVTKFIGMKEFRQNMATYTKKARAGQGVRYIVLRKNVPVLEVMPVDEKAFAMEKLAKELDEAEEDIRAGRVYSHEDVIQMLGLE